MLEEFPVEVPVDRPPKQETQLEGFFSESELPTPEVRLAPVPVPLPVPEPEPPVAWNGPRVDFVHINDQLFERRASPPKPTRRLRPSTVAALLGAIVIGVATGWWLSWGFDVSAAAGPFARRSAAVISRPEVAQAARSVVGAVDEATAVTSGAIETEVSIPVPDPQPAAIPQQETRYTGTAGLAAPSSAAVVDTRPSAVVPAPPAASARVEHPRPEPPASDLVADRNVPVAEFDQGISTRLGNPVSERFPEPPPARPVERAPVVTAAPSPAVDETGVRSALLKYQTAYRELDAAAAKRVWPSVDERALARAFAGLESQLVVFDTCSIFVDAQRARAACSGHSHYVGRVGSRTTQVQSRDWTFMLRKAGEDWEIDSVSTR